MTRPIRIGVLLQPGNTPDFATWRSAVLHAEELGADLIFGWDHFHRPEVADLNQGIPILAEVQPDVTNFEGWTALASWGEITHRAEIGLLVSGIGYRNPDLLADMARTVDHISGGRLVLGLGAGWYEKDYTTYGYDFGSWKSRFDLFDAGLKRIEARFGQLIPPPVRKIPILIGGTGPKRTLPAVVRYADIWQHVPLGGGLHRSQRPTRRTGRVGGTRRKRHRTLGALVRHAQRRGLPRRWRDHVHHRERAGSHHRLRLQHVEGDARLA